MYWLQVHDHLFLSYEIKTLYFTGNQENKTKQNKSSLYQMEQKGICFQEKPY